ncbi:MAG: TIGR00341 family protein [bacterium]
MFISLFENLSEEDKSNAVERLISTSTPSSDFFLMIVLSVLMATFGLLLGSGAVIIGSMLVAPILSPILSLALGITMSDAKLISRSTSTILKSIIISIGAAILPALFFVVNHKIVLNPEIIARTEPSLAYAVIAIIAGFAASFALVKPRLNETLPGIAISVALIPPLAVTGIGIAMLDWGIVSNAFLLFVVNAIGIIFIGTINFSLMNFYVKRKVAEKTIKKEEQEQKKLLEESKKNKTIDT